MLVLAVDLNALLVHFDGCVVAVVIVISVAKPIVDSSIIFLLLLDFVELLYSQAEVTCAEGLYEASKYVGWVQSYGLLCPFCCSIVLVLLKAVDVRNFLIRLVPTRFYLRALKI
jgi:hypothetical protein